MASSLRPRIFSLLRAASSAVCDERMSFCAWIRVACDLLVILQRHRLALEQILGAGVLQLREIERRLGLVQAGHGGDEIVLRLHRIGGFDHEQRLPLRDGVAGLRQQPDHPAGIGREHRRRAILIDGDLAFGDVLGPEVVLGHGLDGQARPFGRRRRVAARPFTGLARHVGIPRLCPAELRKAEPGRPGEPQQGRANDPFFSAKQLRLLDNFGRHRIRSTRR